MNITAHTKVCAIIGNPVKHSKSPVIHNAAFQAAGLDYVYVAFEVKDLRRFMDGFRTAGNFTGLSVTIPHKIELIEYLDDIDPVSRAIGSVNTVSKRPDGSVAGCGTDGQGALKALEKSGVSIKNARIVIIGSGGAARAVALTLAMERAPQSIILSGIDEASVRSLAADISSACGCSVNTRIGSSAITKNDANQTDILINCSPVGMQTHDSPVKTELLHPDMCVFDIVYTPRETALIQAAKKAGCKTVVLGEAMFLEQAAAQFKFWTGVDAPIDVMRTAFFENG